jgi:hypothetical protein
MGLSFTIAAGPRQRSHSQIWVPRDSWPLFSVTDSRLSQPGGSGPRIYNPQEQCGPVIPAGTGFPFRRLLRLAGLRWRYSTPRPYGDYERMSSVSSLKSGLLDFKHNGILTTMSLRRIERNRGKAKYCWFYHQMGTNGQLHAPEPLLSSREKNRG